MQTTYEAFWVGAATRRSYHVTLEPHRDGVQSVDPLHVATIRPVDDADGRWLVDWCDGPYEGEHDVTATLQEAKTLIDARLLGHLRF